MSGRRILAGLVLLSLTCGLETAAQEPAAETPLQSYSNSRSSMLHPAFSSIQSSDLLTLLSQPQIRDELKLSADQQTAVREIMSLRMRAQREASVLMQDLRKRQTQTRQEGASPDSAQLSDMRTAFEAYRKAHDEAQANAENAIFETLDPQQSRRLLQIQLQIELKNSGLAAIAQAPLADILTITDDQKRQLVEKQLETKAELDRMIEVLRNEMEHEALSTVLSPAQMERLTQMKGKPLELQGNDAYSHMLRRQILGDDRTFSRQLLDGARKAVEDAAKDLKDNK